MHIQFLPAYNGDSIYINYEHEGESVHILIDGGTALTYESKGKKNEVIDGALKTLLAQLREAKQKINLLILTHIDDDHIGGILKWMEKDAKAIEMIENIWFNSGRSIAKFLNDAQVKIPEIPLVPDTTTETGVNQGVTFEKNIRDKEIWDEAVIRQQQSLRFRGLEFKILSPSTANLKELHDKWEKERSDTFTAVETDYAQSLEHHLANIISDPDSGIHNGSSIAFILVYDKKNLLFLGDAHIKTIIDGLHFFGYSLEKPLAAEFVKLSHHGSNRNLNIELLGMIDTNEFIISTDGLKHGHPDKKGLAKIIKCKTNPLLRFNYPTRIDTIFSVEDRKFIDFKTGSVLDGIVIEPA